VITTPASTARYTATFATLAPGHGLSAEYFDNFDLAGPSVSRVDASVDFNWGTASPVRGIGANDFSVRWTGQVQPRTTGTHTFITTTDDGVRLWVGGQLLIDNWHDHSATEDTGAIALVAGQRYSITMEYYEGDVDAVAKLEWSAAGQAREVIPPGQLYPAHAVNFQPASAPVPADYVSDAGALYGHQGNGLRYGWDMNSRAQTRDRNAPNSPDQRYDTLIHLQKRTNPSPFWEFAVANGTYRVHLVAGDPEHNDSVYRVAVEGTLAVSGTPTRAARWVEGSVTVTVMDGRLTITNAQGSKNNKLCFVDIERLS
jgi:hypothetical protein